MSNRIFITALFTFLYANLSLAATVQVMGERNPSIESNVVKALSQQFDLGTMREVRLQMPARHGDHVIAFLFSNRYHKVDLALAELDSQGHVRSLEPNYRLREGDVPKLNAPHCPDATTQFVVFAPNNIDVEQQVTADVANTAISKGLKTVQLLLDKATAQNYVDYLSCPNLVGNFYDGDANPDLITTADGVLASTDMTQGLTNAFRFKVTNIWLACQAYNDPMLSTVINTLQTQKYAAGKNDLLVGPSDQTGACSMKAAINGQPMTAAFEACYKQLDSSDDQWGFDGKGSDYFGQ